MIPIGDDNPTYRIPIMTYLLIAANVAVWVGVEHAGLDGRVLAARVCDLGLVPGEITRLAPVGQAVQIGEGLSCVVDRDAINVLTPLIAMFLHGGWLHLIGNMLYLWVFGNNVEEVMGRGRFLAFYLICGLVAAAAHIAADPSSPVPMVGASGAISGVLGAYLLLFPSVYVRMFVFVFIVRVRAWAVLLYWFVLQAIGGLDQLNQLRPGVSSGVAVWAHVGGFVAGLVLVKFFVDPDLVTQRTQALQGGIH
jgi:membrane associated rhomboid family serine protease